MIAVTDNIPRQQFSDGMRGRDVANVIHRTIRRAGLASPVLFLPARPGRPWFIRDVVTRGVDDAEAIATFIFEQRGRPPASCELHGDLQGFFVLEDAPPPSDRFIFDERLSAAVVAAVLSVLGPRVVREHEELCRQITERFGADADEAADWSQLVREIQQRDQAS